MTEMPVYVCHKRVRALEIAEVGNYVSATEGALAGSLMRYVTFAGQSESSMLRDELFRRYVPAPGDFYVVYEDGYESFSPRKAFVDGYVREEAIEALPHRIDQALADMDNVYASELRELLRDCRAEITYLRRLRNPALGPEGNVMMERLNDLAQQGDRSVPEPEWLTINNYAAEIARVAREAYVTINSLKFQLEQKTNGKTDQA